MAARTSLLALLLTLALAGCKRRGSEPPPPAASPADPAGVVNPPQTEPPATTSAAMPSRTPAAPPPAELWKEFSGDRAMAEVRAQVGLGPRPAGSAEIEKARELITTGLKRAGWDVQRQEFSDDTPRGPIRFVNLIGRFAANGARPAPANTQQAIVCSHFDTKRFSTIRFLGASDGASSTGALVELARVLALDPALAAKVELVFFDGEEALTQFTETDGLYGSRFYAKTLRESGRAAQFKFGILWDMIGDRDLTITLPPDSPAELARGIFAAADALGTRSHFSYLNRSILDDHVPLNQIKIPTIDLIDFDYLYWHTQDDTLDKLGAESLQTVGAATVWQLRKALGK